MSERFKLQIPMLWQLVRDVREWVGEALKDQAPSLRLAAIMCVSELVENAVKYGDSVANAPCVEIDLAVLPGTLRMSVQNGCSNATSIHELCRRIDELATCPDRTALYLQKLRDLIDRPGDGAHLGIYRIGVEGGFDLSCSVSGYVVTVIATRNFS